MGARGIVIGRAVDPVKAELARQYRRQMTPAERTLWQRLRANRLNGLHFRRQQVVDGFIVDFYCHAAGLVVEVDGSSHDHKAAYDIQRDRVLAAMGLRVMRVTNEQVLHELPVVLASIAAKATDLSPAPSPAREGELTAQAPAAKRPSPRWGGIEGEVRPPHTAITTTQEEP